MNDYELLKNIFSNFTVDGVVIPVEYIKYKGNKKTYVTYTFTGDNPSIFGDDKEIASVISVDIDVYSEGNFIAIVNQIKTLMEANDFIRVNTSPDMYEDDTGLYHKTIEYEKERMG